MSVFLAGEVLMGQLTRKTRPRAPPSRSSWSSGSGRSLSISASLFLDVCFFVYLFFDLSLSLFLVIRARVSLSLSLRLSFSISLSLGLDLSFLSQFLSTSLYISAFLLFSVSSPPLSISISLFSVSCPLSIFPYLSLLPSFLQTQTCNQCFNLPKQKQTKRDKILYSGLLQFPVSLENINK